MFDVKLSYPMHSAIGKKDFKVSLAAVTLCLYSIAMNLRPSLPGYYYLDLVVEYIISIYLFQQIEW